MESREIRTWDKGIINKIEADSIPVGSLEDSLNFVTRGDKMELRRGYKVLGSDAGAGSVGGMGVGINLDSAGTQRLFRKRKGQRKIEYWDSGTDAWVETGSDLTPTAANNDDFEFDTYQSPAGSQLFASSPNSSIYKIMVANPAFATDLLSTTYRGFLRIKQSRTFLWNRKDANGRKDEQNLYLSHIDVQAYTTVGAEALGDVASGTLEFKAAGAKRTCFGVKITHTGSGEIFTDNRDGTLTGSAGATGTINYTTGAFTTTLSGAGTADYQWEDSTSDGICDFTFSATRLAGEGDVFLQGDKGPLMGVESYGDIEYCGHLLGTYALTLTADDTNATNLIFRDREGIPNHRAIKGTSQGVFYVNSINNKDPQIKVLTLQRGSSAIDGVNLSQNVDLSGYDFSKAWIGEWGDYIMIGCKTLGSDVNNRIILYNKIWRSFDIADFYADCMAVLDGVLVLGESLTGNVVEAFSGVDDNGAAISGFAQLNIWDIEYKDYLKKAKKLQIEGEIGPDQVIDVKVSIDRGSFITVGQIKGSGAYVDRGQRINVGSLTLGRGEIGGGSSGLEAYHYYREIPLRLDRFEDIQVRFETGIDSENNNAEGIGYFSFSLLRAQDIRVKAQKIPRKYR